MKKIILSVLFVCSVLPVYSATHDSTDVYLLAQTQNVQELQKVENIDIVNKKGDTALCAAIKDGNVDAYKLLKDAGANIEHKCVKKIPAEQYHAFTQKLATTSKPWSFLGLGKWAWTAIGAGVVAGGAAAATGGGSGGSGGGSGGINCGAHAVQVGDSCQCNSGYWHWQEGVGCSYDCGINAYPEDGDSACVCYQGYHNWTEGIGCLPINCGDNAYHYGTQCVCNPGAENYTPGIGCSPINLDCGDNAYHDGTQCVCNNGYENWIDGIGCSLVDLNCGNHATQQGVQCICDAGYENWTEGVGCELTSLSCGANATQVGNECYCNPGYQDWEFGYGCHQTLNCGANATQVGDECICNSGYAQWTEDVGCYPILNCGINATQNGDSCVCNSGYHEWTNGYGCYQILNCGANAYQSGDNCVCNSGYENWIENVGCELVNCGANAVLNGTQCECLAGYDNWQAGVGCGLYGIFAENGITTNNNTITLNNTSESPVYGINSIHGTNNSKVINQTAGTVNNVQGYITITNSGNEYVYGIRSDAGYITNAYSQTSTGSAPDYTSASADGRITITNNGNGNIYGVYSEKEAGAGGAYNNADVNARSEAYGQYTRSNAYGVITINNNGDGDVYGIKNEASAFNALTRKNTIPGTNNQTIARGYISIENTGNGNVTGIQAVNAVYNVSRANNGGTAEGNITISNHGNGNVYGLRGSGVVCNVEGDGVGKIDITNDGLGTVYGMYTSGTMGWGSLSNEGASGTYIKIYNENYGKVYGMYAGGARASVVNDSEITIYNLSNGEAVGIYDDADTVRDVNSTITNSGTINMNNVGAGTVIGIFGNRNDVSVDIINEGTININNVGTGTAIGMLLNNSNASNSGTINITRNSFTLDETTHGPTTDIAGNVYGIYAKSGSTFSNGYTGVINITSNGGTYGIYAEPGATITNSGTITINGFSCTSNDCGGNYIVLNGSTLYNSGLMMAPQMNLDSFGGNVMAGLGSQFVVDNALSGDLNISSNLVQNGNQTTYIAENMIDAGDVSGLNVRSASAMFNASLADNGHDVVMQMKDFNELTDNASLAAFLKNNYTNGNGAELFSTLKSLDNMSAFNSTLSGLTGLNTFTQFAHEDLSAMREISFSMNNKLFENSSRDSFDISDSTGYFSFSNDRNGGSGRYGISSDKISDNWKLGYGMAMANINTGDGDSMHRQNNLWLFYMPATYTNDDIELVVAPKAGFAHSEYNRRGYNNINYDGYIEKRIFGLMNDLRYPLTFGNWTFAPDLAFNAIIYDQSGCEEEQEFSLIIPDDRTVSVETGLGFYTRYEKQLSDGSKFKLNSGLMLYREFGDTYDIKLGMRGMDGTFNLYNNDYEYRGAASLGFDYMSGYLHLYGNAQYFMDNDNYMNFKGGFGYRF